MKESDIRPRELFDRFLRAAEDDVERLFADKTAFEEIPCPACASKAIGTRFVKLGFEYRLCGECGSLYLSPRPGRGQFDRFYRESKAVEFFATSFYRDTEEARRVRLFRPRAEMAAQWAKRLDLADTIADVGAGYGTFLEEVTATGAFRRLVAIEPAAKLAAVCRDKGFDVIEEPVEHAGSAAALATFCTSFEVFEHVHDPLAFVRALGNVLRPGGAVLFTTLTISGFDLRELWDRSKSITPPHHVNFCSVAGIERLVARAGLEIVDLSTPGQLDVDIVANMAAEDETIPLSRFARAIIAAPESTRQQFQAFLQEHRLSSHVRVIARKPRQPC